MACNRDRRLWARLAGYVREAAASMGRLEELRGQLQDWRRGFQGHAVIRLTWEKVGMIWRCLRDPTVRSTDKALLLGPLLYLLAPPDMVPDWVPGAGFVDDLAVLALVITVVARGRLVSGDSPDCGEGWEEEDW